MYGFPLVLTSAMWNIHSFLNMMDKRRGYTTLSIIAALVIAAILLSRITNFQPVTSPVWWNESARATGTRPLIKYAFRDVLINAPFTTSDVALTSEFRELVRRRVSPDDENLVTVARAIIEEPTQHPYKVRTIPITPQNKAVMEILNKKVTESKP